MLHVASKRSGTGQEGFSHIITIVAVLVVFGAVGAFFHRAQPRGVM